MAIRLRKINESYVALCAVESDEKPGDMYLHDGIHHALATKFALDWHNQYVDWADETTKQLMETQKVRDALDSFNGDA